MLFRPTLIALVLCSAAAPARAHDIPVEATAHLLAEPSGDQMQVVVRVPLSSMRDVEFPAFGPGYLDIEAFAPQLHDVALLWIANAVELYENGDRLPRPEITATQISIQSDRSLESIERAVEHITSPLPANGENLVWNQVWFDVLLTYSIQSEESDFSMRPGLHMLAARVRTVLRFILPDGTDRAYQFRGDPGVVPLDPSWFQAARQFVELGFLHILDGIDHLLFLLCLVVPFRKVLPLVWIVTAFTVAHSITLICSAYGWAPDGLWFPPLVETLIAVSILWMALENIADAAVEKRRWAFALGFGLIHGFGFSFALRETLQFAGSHHLTSLLAFNVGVEMGQLLVLVLLVPALSLLFRYVVKERMGVIIISALAAHTAWHWMVDRGAVLAEFDLF